MGGSSMPSREEPAGDQLLRSYASRLCSDIHLRVGNSEFHLCESRSSTRTNPELPPELGLSCSWQP